MPARNQDDFYINQLRSENRNQTVVVGAYLYWRELGVPNRFVMILVRNGCYNVEILKRYTLSEILRFPGMGPAGIAKLQRFGQWKIEPEMLQMGGYTYANPSPYILGRIRQELENVAHAR